MPFTDGDPNEDNQHYQKYQISYEVLQFEGEGLVPMGAVHKYLGLNLMSANVIINSVA